MIWPLRNDGGKKPLASQRLPVDWTSVFDGSAELGVLVASVKELHLRILVLEGDLAEERRLRHILQEKIEREGK